MSEERTAGTVREVNVQTQGFEAIREDGVHVKVEAVAPDMVRVRVSPDGDYFVSGLERYRFLKHDWPPVEVTVTGDDAPSIATPDLCARLDRATGRVSFGSGPEDDLLAETAPAAVKKGGGFNASFAIQGDEEFVGLGDQTRERLRQRGHKGNMWITNVKRYAPVPLIMSTRGYAVFLNTTFRHEWDMGATDTDAWSFHAAGGGLDYYVIVGKGFAQLLDRYTEITGKPQLPPRWSFGLWFIANQWADARDVLDVCHRFRSLDIPCDVMGLEPGWTKKLYDYSTDKDWHPDRFFIPEWAKGGQYTFAAAMKRMGFKLMLWLCQDYDLSWHEEAKLADKPDGAKEDGQKDADREHFEGQDELDLQARRMDRHTKPEEPWFEHLKKFVDEGAELFKQDGSQQTIPHPDRKWANGMDDEEMHNLYPLIYSKQMHQGFREHTGRRATCFTPCGWAGLQRYTGTWSGDTGGGAKPLVSLLNLALSGHSLTTVDMEVTTPAGIHFGFLQPWAQVCSWNYYRHPWLLGDTLKPVFQYYTKLRYRLLPYIYSVCMNAYRTGMPMLRAMPLAYPDDRRTYDLLGEYLFGPAFLVTAFTDDLYVPEGTWHDYWTGERFDGPKQVHYTPPADRGGALLVKAGSIVPMWPVMDYVGQRPVDRITLDVYPGAVGGFTLYEDDGVTYAFEQGEVAETHLTCHPIPHGVQVRVGRREGSYAGMPERPAFDVQVHVPARPTRVRRDGRPVRRGVNGWAYDDDAGVVTVPGPAGPKTALTFEVTWGRARRRPTPGR